ncbi:2-amino-4-hydroxy-6-hydroxymethyldihydropteridine diphosphokinase [candidate division WOR-3 bacterium RBG_13_43_14]|uniref:2-amino-4-hydroxy-6-hydroxymethyldihydropteridine diphosphokinase n=1 Tax=candidate division WOR-3 bacterium RBG_13_43_14 TaxID=1802590 RepID=A0A1F4U258_UNCW3|nr:MAG: 2-amino-4-hydroxy-6-hydroxymethyldihydropteridine diphosphokinase [candidate division WOR-3 bacterium RBG_13_43_14]
MASVMLLLGSNQGDMKGNLYRACQILEHHSIHINRQTKIYKTKPVGKVDQPDFLNQGLYVDTDLTPQQLLAVIKNIELAMGRDMKSRRWGSRLIDIDILFYERMKIKEPNLQIPHPEFFKRPFAQIIAAELIPDFKPPGKKKRFLNMPGE